MDDLIIKLQICGTVILFIIFLAALWEETGRLAINLGLSLSLFEHVCMYLIAVGIGAGTPIILLRIFGDR